MGDRIRCFMNTIARAAGTWSMCVSTATTRTYPTKKSSPTSGGCTRAGSRSESFRNHEILRKKQKLDLEDLKGSSCYASVAPMCRDVERGAPTMKLERR